MWGKLYYYLFYCMIFFTLISIAAIVISVVFHEVAHGYMSYRLGDPTPTFDNRLSFNPKYHITKMGAILFLLLLVWPYLWLWSTSMQWLGVLAAIVFAKPVLINPGYYKNPLRDKMLVALAGPLANIILAFCGFALMFFYAALAWYDYIPLDINQTNDIVLIFWEYFCWLNISLALFNLIPIPPLDGFAVVTYFFPSLGFSFKKYNSDFLFQYFFLIILLWPWRWFVSIYLNTIIAWAIFWFKTFFEHIF